MTVTTTTNKITYSGNGATTVFTFPFPGVAAADLSVTLTDASGVMTVASPSTYSVLLNPPSPPNPTGVGGSITYPLVGPPVPTGTSLTILRTLPAVQLDSISNQSNLYQSIIETALDYLTMLAQQSAEDLSRCLQVPASDPPLMRLPAAAARANKALTFDSSGQPVAGGTVSGVVVSAAMVPVVQAATLALARTAMGLGTAAVKGVSDPAQANVASAVGSFLANTMLVAADANGSVRSGGPRIFVSSNDGPPAGEFPLPLIYQGWNFGSYNNTILYCNPGTMSDANGKQLRACNAILRALSCDVSTQGINTAYVPPDPLLGWSSIQGGLAEAPPVVDGTPLNFYLVSRDSDGALALMASKFGYSGFIPLIPAGWSDVRLFRFACVYKTGHGTNWNGLPQFFQNIDNSFTLLSGSGKDANYRVASLTVGSGTISFVPWLHNSCRTALIYVDVNATGGSPGTASIGNGTNKFDIGQTTAATDHVYGMWLMKLDSGLLLPYAVTGNTRLDVYLMGWSYDDPV